MSMISAQCDELRFMAESVGLEMPQAATLMMEAADALDSLDLALDSKRIAERRVTELLTENGKLRELVKALLTCATDGDCDECRLNGATPWHVGKAQLCDGVWDRMRELGVEVDG